MNSYLNRVVSKSFELPNGGTVVVDRYSGSGKYVCAIRGYSPEFGEFEEVNDFHTMANRDELFEYFDEASATKFYAKYEQLTAS